MSHTQHASHCQKRRLKEHFDSIDSGEELCELEHPMNEWARRAGLQKDANGSYNFCTCYPADPKP